MNALEQTIIKFIAENCLLNQGDKLLIAFSGGADSVFALSFLDKYRAKYKIQICALHVNHSLRGSESDTDEKFCRVMCKNMDIEFYSEKVNVSAFAKNTKLSIEEAARNLRYGKLNDILRISNSNKIVTAHNLDDNTETVLLNLFRGSGLKGLSGIPIKRDNIIRPFLSANKEKIILYLNKRGIKFRVDSTNNENQFKRNYLRNEIIPKIKDHINKGVDQNIFKFSQIAKNSEIIINNEVKNIISEFVTFTESEIKILKKIKITAPLIMGEVFKQTIEGKFSVSIEYDNILSIQKMIDLQVGRKTELAQNLEVVSERDYLLIKKKEISSDELLEVKLNFNNHVEFYSKIIGCTDIELNKVQYSNSGDTEFIDADNLTAPLIIRRWKDHDSFNPLGLKGTKKVSDFLTEQKVANIKRKEQLVLLSEEKIIWIVGYRIDESIKISKKTKRIVKLWVK